ncbi:Holliday junction resolvase RuvX [candidate division WWE3 bacterium CG_4_9_14_0_2_um_filter_35_11]|uniref:Putative pre-16S rRNA nuclease n=1 Tax=candidate division WWE3 bacterium CG_4_9_14_0_2_um_filter_35_11 TaxID=1975077 RepID=A0A2M8ELE8_UNCKA|nr:MAG: Holliday junction resolvase RuvX [candidate division WWE3 bacterium CG10_big_fil_rev_8_21_14_0_10_35_32]PJC23559.1 MAG: Holliday junction resolvase RuvX [candidate division WWE3 bacterium CG_4_9_14_0_2_um_filter_35_11]
MRILGIDYGEKNIGIAIGVNDIVEPFGVFKFDIEKSILKIVEDERIDAVVIGLPFIKGESTKASPKAKAFGDALKEKLPNKVNLFYVDEFGTTNESNDIALASGVSQKRRKVDDAIAACQIIKRFIEDFPLSNL